MSSVQTHGPEGHVTVVVIEPVTIAPFEGKFPRLLFVVTVAEINVSPHAIPATETTPVALTVAMSGVFEVQVTRLV
ncbi:MAG: hypothetical protein QOD84_3128, partial [Acidobacteriaceae bacterium]